MYILENDVLRYRMDSRGRSVSFYNKQSSHEYIYQPGAIWKLIYSVLGTEQVELAIWADDQNPTIQQNENELVLAYDKLKSRYGELFDASVVLRLSMDNQGLRVVPELENHDARVDLMEFQLTPVSGARSLAGKPHEDYIAWPNDLGRKIRNPAFSDLSSYAGFRKYERNDQFHTDLDAMYQSGGASMQWYDWYTENEGLYCACEDLTRHAVTLHIERDVKLNLLRFGFIRYPMLKAGESWQGAACVFYPHLGDWHSGAKIYRAWMEKEGGLSLPEPPEWCREFTGWLRVILKQHHGEINWTYADIPRLYDEVEAAGFKTLYLLGWEKGGFARMWPDFEVDDRLGGAEKLREGIRYVHNKGGKVLMFLSYALIDHQSKFYLEQGGDKATIKSIWNQDIPFSETYCGEGTYRKIANPPMPMYVACPGAPIWQEKMKEAAKICLDLGADGVLYDIGGMKPFFCYAEGHTHQKPSHSHERKADNYAGLRDYVKSYGDDKIILMEHNVDIYAQHMDVSHGSSTVPAKRLHSPETVGNYESIRDDFHLLDMYRYTFPEFIMTNRECGQDEEAYLAIAGYSFLYGLRFDMTIYRCCGSLSDIPNYAAYLKKLNGLYAQFSEYILKGTFVDSEGITWDNKQVFMKGWRSASGKLAVTLWNPTDQDQTVEIESASGKTRVTVAAQMADAAELL